METPTPVSALMHAGIVNAGGYLMIRTSPLVAMTPWAMMTLAIVGAVTACFAAVVMLTQTSVKKRLAYSTIAQMGFMMLQCGLGAFSAAMLHIIAHSLYKAHAFLSSGSVIAELAATRGAVASRQGWSWKYFAIGGVACAISLAVAFVVTGIDPVAKPGGLLLGSVLCVSLTYWVAQVMQSGNRLLTARALTVAGLLCGMYSVAFAAIDRNLVDSLPSATAPALPWLVACVVATGFLGLFALQVALASGRRSAFLDRWHIHAANGFYVESLLRRAFGPLLKT